jgi:hypothetical protein
MAEEHTNEKKLKAQQPVEFSAEILEAAAGDPQGPKPTQLSGIGGRATKLNLTKIVKVINDMVTARVIGRYAIGGAVGATFYLEPTRTVDVDIFVPIHAEEASAIAALKPIYDYLAQRGYSWKGQHLVIEDWPVDFLTTDKQPLVHEAVVQANEFDLEGERTFVFSAEHLVAVALQTDRPKDKARIIQFLEEQKVDLRRLQDVIQRHQLLNKWARFRQQFYEKEP